MKMLMILLKRQFKFIHIFKLTHKYRGKMKSLSTKFKQSSKLMLFNKQLDYEYNMDVEV